MIDLPVRPLVIGYGLAACMGAGIAFAGGGILWVGGVVWIGGAVATLGAAALSARGRRPAAGAGSEDASANLVLADELRRWEEDRLSERGGAVASAARRRA